ncbi:MAG: ATP-binding protein [Elusimicrobia bacterium]|nr:ATP-binding protein [Elusimicrobiota bacterium]MBP9127906.1 ATP-binding protein [Elusimicrobiota bacterium]MBP9699447.1 ATP-binding protein [Elusimicrobiota bacterium]
MKIHRPLTLPKQSFFLLGPRGTGKSTWLKESLSQAHVVDLLDETVYQRCLADPSVFQAEVGGQPPSRWIVVDEIQRLPNLLNEVHRAIESSGRRFALCGSSARKLRRTGVNLLGGRALQRFMHPFTPAELGDAFDVDQALRFGLLPVVLGSTAKAETLVSYAQLYLKEEIQGEALVRNLPGFARFLPIAALLNGQVLNVSNIARDAAVARPTVHGYLDILVDTLLCFRLPAFEAKLRVRERRHPKWYWCDPGLVRAMKRQDGPLTMEERGSLFEGLVAQLIRASMDYNSAADHVHYWAPAEAADVEVDFLLTRGARHVAVEVKSGPRPSPSWVRGLKAIQGLPGLTRRLVVYPQGPKMALGDGIEGVSLAQFSQWLREGKLF